MQTTVTFDEAVNLIKQLSLADQWRVLEWLVGHLKEMSLQQERLNAGSAKGLITIADDFDEPLEDFKEYTQ